MESTNDPTTERIAFRTCPLCEAGCGLELSIKNEQVVRIRGDKDDVFSHGFVCPKGTTLGHLHSDPDWLRQPHVKRDGEFVAVDWDEAFAVIEAGLMPVLAEHGRDAAALYLGNPGAHSLAPLIYNGQLIKALGSRNRFSASTVDQRPKEISSAMMFGSVAIPVPDLDRTDYLLMLGANPYASNGSLCTAPDFPGRLEAIQARGGKVVCVDPRRSETAAKADQHVEIRPGTDAHLLAAIAHTLLARGWADPSNLADHCTGIDDLEELFAPYSPEAVASICGIATEEITTLARELAEAPTAAVYGRIGTCTQEFGTLASWLVDVVNLLTGNLDSVGGAMFAKGAAGQPSTKGAPGEGRGFAMGRVVSRVSSSPESLGEFSVAVLAEEMETPGDGQIRALITVGGNPVSSTPNSQRLDAAIAGLDFVVSVDPYINETTRHADVILPPPTPLQKSHYDVALLNLAVRNVANYSAPVFELEDTQMSEGEIMQRLIALLSGQPFADFDASELDEMVTAAMLASSARDPHSKVADREPAEMAEQLSDSTGADRVLEIMLRTGPYGDGFGADPDGLTLERLVDEPHGIDLGALEPGRIPDLLRTPSGKVEVVPEPLRADLARLTASLERAWDDEFVLIGRRHVRSNNSWMHNIRVLTKGRNRCTMQIHPDDAQRIGLGEGGDATVTSRVGSVTVAAEITDGIRPGVVSIPHGFGQDMPGVQLSIATAYRGVNTNVLTDETFVDELSGNIALNGVPVSVAPA